MTSKLTGIKILLLLLVVVLKYKVFQKNPHTIAELKTTTQSEIETVSAYTQTNVPNKFFLRLYKVRDLWGHHMKLLFV
jgi:hypothetical protein